jgi:hypothetical protein
LILLRVLGLIVAVGVFLAVVRRIRRRSIRVGDAILGLLVALALGTVAIAPASVDPVLRELGFPPGDARRVIGVLVIATLVLFALVLRGFAKTDKLEGVVRDYSHRVAARAFVDEFGTAKAPPEGKLVVVIPALDEENSLGAVLEATPKEVEGMPVESIVVSDGSTDTTEEVAVGHGALVARCDLRQGQGAAVSLGYRLALLRDASVVATLDADGQYVPEELPQLVKPIVAGEADVVHGSRVLGAYESPIRGRAHGVRVLSWVTSRMARVRITDPASGFRAFTPEALRRVKFREPQFHASEATVAAAKAGLRVREVPCTFRERSSGTTKKPPLLRYGYGYTRSLIRTWLG